MSDTSNTQDPYRDGEVPADADISTEDVAEALPGAGRLDEGQDDPNVDASDIKPSAGTPLP